jgi:hypothetical protein
MKRVVKRSRTLLIIGIILWFVVFPVYLNLSVLDDWDAIFPYLYFKAIDQDNSVAILEHKEKILIPTFVVKQHSEVNPLLEHIPDFSLCVFALCSKPLFLRC